LYTKAHGTTYSAVSPLAASRLARPDGLNFGNAIYYATAGEADAMFEALGAAYWRRDLLLPSVQRVVFFASYRAGPRYRNLLTRMNLA
jgi:hypothetical protein